MARACSVCTHRQHASIDQALVQGVDSNRRVATQHGLTEAAVRRHAAGHLPAKMTQAQEAQEVSEADELLAQVRQRLERAERHVTLAEGLCARAAGHGDVRGAVAAVQAAVAANRETRACLELQLKLQGQLAEQASMSVNVNVESNIDGQISLSIAQREQRIFEIIERAYERQQRGELPPGSAAIMREAYGPDNPRTTLAQKLDSLHERRGHRADYTELHTLKRGDAGVPDATECDTPKRPVVPPPVAPPRNGRWGVA